MKQEDLEHLIRAAASSGQDDDIVVVEPAVELSAEWTDAVRSRLEELEAGDVQAVPWSDVERRIRDVLNRAV